MSKYSPEAFRQACGDSGAMGLLAKPQQGPGAGFCFDRQPFAVVGRNKVSDVILDDQLVSRRHAYLQILNGSVFCVDLKSRWGIHWDEGPRFADWLCPMHSVQVGGSTLYLLGESSAATHFQTCNPMAAGCLEQPYVTLEFLSGRKAKTEWSVDRLLTLMGTASGCKIRFDDPKVAPVHASLVCTREGAWVVDLLSSTGTYVNGERVRLARLEDNDELRIGIFAMRVHCRPVTSFVVQSTRIPSHLSLVPTGTAKNGQITKGLVLASRQTTLDSFQQNSQALEDHAGKTTPESILLGMAQQMCIVQNQMFDQFQQTIALMFQMFGTLQKEQFEVLRAELDRVQSLTREIQALQLELKAPLASAPVLAAVTGTHPMSVSKRGGQSPTLSVNAAPTEHQTGPSEENTQANGVEVHALLCQRMEELQEDRRSRIQKMMDFLSGR